MAEVLAFEKDQLREGDVRIVTHGSVEIGVFRENGRYYAYRNVCPHQGGPVCEGMRIPKVETELHPNKAFKRNNFNLDEMHFVCPWHGWEYKLETGECVGDPTIRLQRFEVSERDGKIYVDV